MARIAARLQLTEAGVRGPGYEFQAKELINDLFAGNLDMALTRMLGFTAAEAVALEEAVTRLGETRTNDTFRMMELLTNNAQEAAFQLQRRGEYIHCVTADELADETGGALEAPSRFLERFSVSFGEGERAHLLTGLSAIRRRPFVRAGDGRYLATSPVNLLWALQPALEFASTTTTALAAFGSSVALRGIVARQLMSPTLRAEDDGLGGLVSPNILCDLGLPACSTGRSNSAALDASEPLHPRESRADMRLSQPAAGDRGKMASASRSTVPPWHG